MLHPFKKAKMKKFILLLLINTTVLFSQNKSGTITYKAYHAVVNKVDSTKVDPEAYQVAMDMLKSLEKLEFSLTYNSKYSKFNLIDKLETETSFGMDMAKKLHGSKEFYYDFSEKYFIKKNDNSLVKLNNSYEWNVTSESKDINGFLCYKAMCDYKFISRKGEIIKSAIAWFCPKIPVNIAPENFNGLPGLVLELNTGSIVYIAKDINFTDEEIKIKFPTGKIITEQENSAIAKAKLEEILNNR